MIKGLSFLAIFFIMLSGVSLAYDFDEKTIHDLYPITKKINLILWTINAHSWVAYTSQPNVIIIDKPDINSKKELEVVMNHELMHYYCFQIYHDIDPYHKRCF